MKEDGALAAFNLLDEPWIPCTMPDGRRESLGLRGVLAQARDIAEIRGDSPLVVAALHRLLLAILHRNFGVEGPGQWGDLWAKGAWDADVLDGYFTRWRHRFDLFDEEHPFYQVAGLDWSKGGSSARLMFHADNNPTLFTHSVSSAPPELAPAEAARLLVGFMAFDVGGTKTSERGQASAKAALLNKGALVLARGKDLFQTLMLNLCRYVPEEGAPWDFDRDLDVPAWERDEATRPEDRSPDGYIDLLTWQSRRIRLQPEIGEDGATVVKNVVIMKGFQPPDAFTLHDKETMLAFRRQLRATPGGNPWPVVTFTEERGLWRDSFALMHSANEDSKPPKVLEWLAELASEDILPHFAILPVDAFGMESNRSKVLAWRHERLPLPLEYLDDRSLVASLKEALELTESTAQDLREVIWSMAKNILATTERSSIRNYADHLGAERAYWPRLEEPFKRFMEALAQDRNEYGEYGDEQIPAWKTTLRATLWDAFGEATRGMERSTRTMKAQGIAERYLAARTYRRLAVHEEGNEDATAES